MSLYKYEMEENKTNGFIQAVLEELKRMAGNDVKIKMKDVLKKWCSVKRNCCKTSEFTSWKNDVLER